MYSITTPGVLTKPDVGGDLNKIIYGSFKY